MLSIELLAKDSVVVAVAGVVVVVAVAGVVVVVAVIGVGITHRFIEESYTCPEEQQL